MLCSARLFSIILFPILSHCSIISGISSLLFLLCSSLVGGDHDDADDADVDDALDDAHEHAWPSTNVGNRASGRRKFMPVSGANGVSPRSTPWNAFCTAQHGRSNPPSRFEISEYSAECSEYSAECLVYCKKLAEYPHIPF